MRTSAGRPTSSESGAGVDWYDAGPKAGSSSNSGSGGNTKRGVLVAPVLDAFGAVKVPCALSTEVQRAMKAGRVGRREAITALAPKLISKTSLVFEPPPRDPRTVLPGEERAFLEQAWPKGTLVLEVSDARWLSHLNVAPPHRLEPH